MLIAGTQICYKYGEFPIEFELIAGQASRSSKVIELGVSRKRICDLPLVTKSNFGRISYRFHDVDV